MLPERTAGIWCVFHEPAGGFPAMGCSASAVDVPCRRRFNPQFRPRYMHQPSALMNDPAPVGLACQCLCGNGHQIAWPWPEYPTRYPLRRPLDQLQPQLVRRGVKSRASSGPTDCSSTSSLCPISIAISTPLSQRSRWQGNHRRPTPSRSGVPRKLACGDMTRRRSRRLPGAAAPPFMSHSGAPSLPWPCGRLGPDPFDHPGSAGC